MKAIRCDGKEFEYEGCFGCACNSQRLPAFPFVIYEDKDFIVEQDFELPINGFIVISSKKCCSSLNDLQQDEKIRLVLLASKVISILKELNIAKEFTIVQEEKENYHFHFWIMPTLKWMKELFGKPLKNIKAIQEYAKENLRDEISLQGITDTCEKIRFKMKEFK